MKVTAVFYYPLLFYPLLLCSSLQHKAGYLLGALLSLTHLLILLWQKVDCPMTPEVRGSWDPKFRLQKSLEGAFFNRFVPVCHFLSVVLFKDL